jgi:DNA recombination protein RmuC
MNAIWMLAMLLAGAVLGGLIGFLYARGRMAGVTADLTGQARAAQERAMATQELAAQADRAAQQRAELADAKLTEHFQALAGKALDESTRRFLDLAAGRFDTANSLAAGELDKRKAEVEHLVQPLSQTLAKLEAQLRESDAARRSSHAALAEQVSIARQSSEQLRTQTQALVTALRRPEARGRWGEMQLRRVVELAGMTARCDFDEQVAVPGDDGGSRLRPDMVVRLAGGKNIVVDSKVSLAAYLEAAEAADESLRAGRLDAHARHLREHVSQLAGKAYWTALSPAPEFVVLFIPGEAFLAPALEHDPGLLEYALAHRVHIATPTTLVTMLRTAQYAWQQEALSDNARAVFDLGRELYDRLSGLGKHVDGLGKALTSAVSAYNRTVGTLESRVLVSARKLGQMGIVGTELDSPRAVDESVRGLSAPDLLAETAPSLVTASELNAGGKDRRPQLLRGAAG